MSKTSPDTKGRSSDIFIILGTLKDAKAFKERWPEVAGHVIATSQSPNVLRGWSGRVGVRRRLDKGIWVPYPQTLLPDKWQEAIALCEASQVS